MPLAHQLVEHISAIAGRDRELYPWLLAQGLKEGRSLMRGSDGWAHQLGLAQQAHQAQCRHGAEVHLLSSLLLPVVQSLLMMEMITGCQCQPHIEIWKICVAAHGSSRSKRSALLVVLESKAVAILCPGSAKSLL